MNGISRKLPDTERARLKKILKEVLPENVGVIVRTAAEGATEEQLDARRQPPHRAVGRHQQPGRSREQAPALLHSEPDLLIKIIRDVFNEDFQKLVIAGDDARQTIENYLRQVAPDLLDRVEAYTGDRDAFDEFRITEQIEKALERKVWLPSGGSLVIDRTEAMTVVDVNTGKFVGSGGNLEETVTKNNLEAAEEIVRQLRLRDIGGIIVVDFIDMVLESNRDLVLRRLVECLSRDRTKHQVAEVTSLGLVQMTRKKLGLGLLETFSEACEVCAGRGVVVHHDPVVKHRQPQQQPNERSEGPSRPAERQRVRATATAASRTASRRTAHSTAGRTPSPTTRRTRWRRSRPHHPATTTTSPSSRRSGQAESRARRRAGDRRRGHGHGEAPSHGQGLRPSDVARPAKPSTEDRADSPRPTPRQRGRRSGRGAGCASAVPLIELPEPAVAAPSRRAPSKEAELLLDSVLDALPQPKQPGQGRGRSRRASTAVIAGGERRSRDHAHRVGRAAVPRPGSCAVSACGRGRALARAVRWRDQPLHEFAPVTGDARPRRPARRTGGPARRSGRGRTRAAAMPFAVGERVQLVERGVADQVRPQHAVGGPCRGIDQDRHRMILGTGAAGGAGLADRPENLPPETAPN